MSIHFSRYPWWRRWFGSRSERAAARFLRAAGFRILASNFSDPQGEIDLLALDHSTLVIVEVRSSATADLERLARSVDAEKQQRLTRATLRFLSRRGLLNRIAIRFDIIAIRWPHEATEPEFRHYRGAFESVGKFQLHA